jgi:tRNA-specific 2-thiouridylase
VTVGPKAALKTTTVKVRGVRLHEPAANVDAVKLRYRSPAVGCALDDNTLTLDDPVHGVAPGQIACLLRGDVVVGCATIVA